jgi:hypothetical protein
MNTRFSFFYTSYIGGILRNMYRIFMLRFFVFFFLFSMPTAWPFLCLAAKKWPKETAFAGAPKMPRDRQRPQAAGGNVRR